MNQEKIGAFISECRKQKGLTQEQVAEVLGVSNRTISKWENGNCMPDYSVLPLLAQTLDITINELLSGEKIKQEDYQKKLEENLIINIGELKRKTQKTFSFILKLIGALFLIFIALSLIEKAYHNYSYHQSVLSSKELNIKLCLEENDIMKITIDAKDNLPIMIESSFAVQKNELIYIPYRIRKKNYMENFPSSHTFNIQTAVKTIKIANQIIYKKGQTLNQCQN